MTFEKRKSGNGEGLVSIITPCYNAATWLAETLASALGQTYKNLEVIVVDDGSKDNTKDIVKSLRDDRVRYIQTEHHGGCSARNTGLRSAGGDFIQFLDADDLISHDKIERQVELLGRSPPACVAVSGVTYFYDGERPEEGLDSAGYPELNSDDPVGWLSDLWTPGPGYGTTRWGMVPPHAWLVPRNIAEKAGYWNEELEIDQDGEYFCRVVLASNGIRWEPVSRVFYRKFRDRVSVSAGRKFRSRLRSVELKVNALNRRIQGMWKDKIRQAVARQFMEVSFHCVPFAPRLASLAYKRARDFGGWDGSEFLSYSPTGRQIARLLGWPLAKAMISGTQPVRKWLRRGFHGAGLL